MNFLKKLTCDRKEHALSNFISKLNRHTFTLYVAFVCGEKRVRHSSLLFVFLEQFSGYNLSELLRDILESAEAAGAAVLD